VFVRSAPALSPLAVLGNSRIQMALSNDVTAYWFKHAWGKYYLLGFSYNEDVVFTEDLLRRMNRAPEFLL
jgi:hypothetical protein